MHTAYVMRAVVAATIIATSIAVVAAPLNPETCSEEDLRAAVAEAFAPTNATKASVLRHLSNSGVFRSDGVVSRGLRGRFPEVFAELDATLADRGFIGSWWWQCPDTWPKSSSRIAQQIGADVAYRESYGICARLGCGLSVDKVVKAGGTLDDCVTLLSEAVAFPEKCFMLSIQITQFRGAIQKAALRAIRRYLRSQGKTFVTKNGVNPVEEYMIGLNTALNAPRFAGLDAWLKSIGHTGVDLSKMPSEEEVAKLKDAVFYGDKWMDNRTKVILEVCLGVDGYNKFVKEYNGD